MTDLHTHTRASDGILSPAELVKKAISEEIAFLSITDHDSLNGIDEAMAAASGSAITVIPGCELSIDFDGGDFHLLGYNISPTSEFISVLNELQRTRDQRVALMVEDLQRNGYTITMNDIESGSSSPGKPHIARALIAKGYAKDMKEVFENFLCKEKPGFFPKKKIDSSTAFRLIRQSGGIPVIAHPVSLNLAGKDLENFIADLKKQGLRGIEAYSSIHDDAMVETLLSIARTLNLSITGGSDFHGDHGEKLGYYGNRLIPDSVREIFNGIC